MRGLVLEGGGVKGSYEVGSYFALRDCHIKIDGFVGTSIGSFNAAMLASGKDIELLDFWNNVNPGELMNFDSEFVKAFNGEKLSPKVIKGFFKTFKDILLNFGIENDGLVKKMEEVISENDLMKSKKDFGLVTVKLPKFESIYLYKEMIPPGKLNDYILASCYLPLFKRKKIVDNHYYLDGGFHDNSPSKMLFDLGYDEIYVIKIKGIGIDRHYKFDNVKVTTISPSRNNGKVFELNTAIIRDNIMMGYYDTLRILKKYDGYKFCFKRHNEWFYNFITRKVDKRLLRRVGNFFDTKNVKEIVLKSLEYILEHEGVTYYDVYKPYKLIRKYKKVKSKHFVYMFLKELKFM